MSLNVILYKSTTVPMSTDSSTRLFLKAETVEHTIKRSPYQVGLPSASAGAENQIFTLDLGQRVEKISCSGLVDVVPDPNGEYTSKTQLLAAARTWWAYGDDATALPVLVIDGSSPYPFVGHIDSLTLRQFGALEDRWNYDLVFVVHHDLNYSPPPLNYFAYVLRDSTYALILTNPADLWADQGVTNAVYLGKNTAFNIASVSISSCQTYGSLSFSYSTGQGSFTPFPAPSTPSWDFDTDGVKSFVSLSSLPGWATTTVANGSDLGFYIMIEPAGYFSVGSPYPQIIASIG